MKLYTKDTQGNAYKIELSTVNTKSLLAYYELNPIDTDLQGETISVCMIKETLNSELLNNDYTEAYGVKY